MKILYGIAICIAFSAFAVLGQSLPPIPKGIVEKFARLDIDGSRLTASGWSEADTLFAQASQPPESKTLMVIASRYGVSESPQQGEKAEFLMGSEELGRIDNTSLIFTPTNAGPTRQFDSFILVRPSSTSAEWKIKGPQPPTMHLSPKAAIAYVSRRRAETSSPVIKTNADHTLAKLKLYR